MSKYEFIQSGRTDDVPRPRSTTTTTIQLQFKDDGVWKTASETPADEITEGSREWIRTGEMSPEFKKAMEDFTDRFIPRSASCETAVEYRLVEVESVETQLANVTIRRISEVKGGADAVVCHQCGGPIPLGFDDWRIEWPSSRTVRFCSSRCVAEYERSL